MNNDANKGHENCLEIRTQLLELNPVDSTTDQLKSHLDQCADCCSFYQDLLSLDQGVAALPEHDVSDPIFNQTLAAIKADKATTENNTKGINPQWATGLAASFVLVAVTGLIYNGSMSEFQADFEPAPYTTTAESKPEKRANQQQPTDKDTASKVANEANNKARDEDKDTYSGTSAGVVFIEDINLGTEVLQRSMPAKPAPAVKNTLNEMLVNEPVNALAMQLNSADDKPFEDPKTAADRMMQSEKKNDQGEQDQLRSQVGRVTVTASRIKSAEPNNGEPMSLDQLEKVVSGVASISTAPNQERLAQFEAQKLKVASEKTKTATTVKTDGLKQEPDSLIDNSLRDNGPMRPLDQLGVKSINATTTENSDINLKREAQFKNNVNKLAKVKAKRAELSAALKTKGELAGTKERDLEPASIPVEKPRLDVFNDGLIGSIDENLAADFDATSSGSFGRYGSGAAADTEDATTSYLTELQSTENLTFKTATGYWANTYLPGDPNMRWIQAQLQKDTGSASDLKLPNVHQNAQPFDYPKNAALALYLNSDRKTLNETGPTRMRLQVGIQAGQQKGGHRSALNLAVVLDLDKSQVKDDLKAETKALLNALLKAKQAADQITVYFTGSSGGPIIAADDFRHGPIQVALNQMFNPESAPQAIQLDLHQTLSAANTWLKTQDDPNAVLGSSAVLLVSANTELASLPAIKSIESLVQQNAIDGITLSTVSLAGVDSKQALKRLALMGQGHSRVLTGVQDAPRLINEELLVSSRAVARALRLQIKLAEGVQLIDVLDSYSLDQLQAQKVRDAEQSLDQRMSKNLGITADRGQDDDGIQMVIPSYFAGDTHVILLDVLVQKPGPVAEVSAKYKDLIYLNNATSQKSLHMSSGANHLGPLELNVMKNVLAQRLSQTVELASQDLRTGDHDASVHKLTQILELYQAMRQHIPAWVNDQEMRQDESIIQQYLQLLNSQSSLDPDKYPLIADSMRFMSWRKLISHSP